MANPRKASPAAARRRTSRARPELTGRSIIDPDFLNLFEIAGGAALVLTKDRVTECNQNALEMFGLTRDQLPLKIGALLPSSAELAARVLRGETVRFTWDRTWDVVPFKMDFTIMRAQLAGKDYLLA